MSLRVRTFYKYFSRTNKLRKCHLHSFKPLFRAVDNYGKLLCLRSQYCGCDPAPVGGVLTYNST